jgi:hypothetical protein
MAMARKQDVEEPTLGAAWTMLGERLGMTVEERSSRSISAHGNVRGRMVTVEIDGSGGKREFGRFLFGLNTISSRNSREKWHTVLSVSCVNPAGLTGTIESAVDVRDPAWNPREYSPRNGRKVRTEPASLADRILTGETHERLMSIMADVQIHVLPNEIRIDDRSTAIPDKGANYVAGSVIHHFQGSPPPMPERAIAGPPWWIDLLCDLADALDRPMSTT